MFRSLACLSALVPAIVFAAPGAADRPAPHFVVVGDGASLPLREQRADVVLAGIGAHVTLTQRYENRGKAPVEARYVFPASTNAAVFAMRITHGGRTIAASMTRRRDAERLYAEAAAAGHTAALLQQERPNVFEMAVANIAPGDSVTVAVEYLERIVPADGKYEFVLPGVVAPRYASPDTRNVTPALPVARAGRDVPLDRWSVGMTIDSGVPIHMIQSPSHAIAPRFDRDRKRATFSIEDVKAADRDLVVEYWLAGGAIETGLIVSPDPGGRGGHFLLQLEPPARVAPRDVLPREYVFVVDVSGSMGGFPLATAKTLLHELTSSLRPEDRFNVVLFAGASSVFASTSVAATAGHIADAERFLEKEHGGGGTELLPALQTAFGLPAPLPRAARIVVVITDGQISEEQEAFVLVREKIGAANLFAFGIGSSVNRHLIEGLAREGRGEPFVVEDETVAGGRADDFRDYISAPVLTGASVRFEGLDVFDVEPPGLPDLFARRPVTVIGRYRGSPRGRAHVKGLTAAGPWTASAEAASTLDGPALRLLWARERIERLDLEGGPFRQNDDEIERLGLEHSLVTSMTSFLAIDRSSRVSEPAQRVDQPVPLPFGVPETALPEFALQEAFTVGEPGTLTIVPGPVLDPGDREDRRKSRESLKCLLPVHTLLLPLKFAPPDSVIPRLEPFLSRQGRIRKAADGGTLLVMDHREELDRIRELARVIDVPEVPRGPAVIASRVELPTGAGIAATDVLNVIDRNLLQVRLCFADVLRENPDVAGALQLVLEVNRHGRVTAAAIEDGELPDTGGVLEACLLDELGTLTFPAARDARDTRVTVEILFGRALVP